MSSITVGITAHAEGVLLHKTLLSVHRAVKQLEPEVECQIIVHLDNPTQETLSYVSSHKDRAVFRKTTVFSNKFGDLGSSRNFIISKTTSKYIAFIDADDLMSSNWLSAAFSKLEKEPYGKFIAHSETTIEFGGANSIVIKHGEIDKETDSLLMVFANRWNSVIFAPTELLKSNLYETNSKGFGYEDWHLNTRLVQQGIHNILIPNTVIFVRRKLENSEWARQIESRAVLRKNPALSFSSVRNNKAVLMASPTKSASRMAKKLISRSAKLRRVIAPVKKHLTERTGKSVQLPEWLIKEMRSISYVEKNLFPASELISSMKVYDSLTLEHYEAGRLYRELITHTNKDSYDYVLVVPWLIKGGADMFSINYANYIKRLFPNLNIMVVATLPVKPVWREKLHKEVDYVPFGEIMNNTPHHVRDRVFEQFIENSGCSSIHIINSEFGYNFIANHKDYVKGSSKKIIATAFSQSVDNDGRIYGYSHTHLPLIVDVCSLVTSDNQALLDMWHEEYGVNSKILALHRQPIESGNYPVRMRNRNHTEPLQILWAARFSPEKLPEVAVEIGKRLKNKSINLTMYGSLPTTYRSLVKNLPSNVKYGGEFDGFETIELEKYDIYLYTSLFDGMPSSIIEAGLHALPVATSAVGGIPEIINDSNGILVSPPDDVSSFVKVIEDLAQNPLELESKGLKLRKTVEREFKPEIFENKIKQMMKVLGYKS